ncbi:MAG TPA: DUF6600 domain-containing protein [Rhodanobacteraceae bacterium]
MPRFRLTRPMLVAAGICALLTCVAVNVQAQQYDGGSQSYDSSQTYTNNDQAPGRIARLAYLSGQVQFAPAGESDWGSVEVNRPMVIGDRLLTGDDGRAVLELGDASVRIDDDSAFDFLNLDQNNVQIELSQGTLNLAVRQLADGENFEVDTPTVAFVAAEPGVYRIDDDPSGTGSMVTVFQGAGTVYGENGVSRQVAAGQSYRFDDSSLANVEVNGLPQPDAFDQFCEARDNNYQRYSQAESQYVPPDMIGGDELDRYGQWNDTPEYGNVWYPSSVPAGWAPYRYGHWAWIDPWGWTWVGDEPWGFAPFHYGRWVYVRSRWGWMPGPVNVRPVYAPALVAFVGGSGFSLSVNLGGGGPVGWFPLGPRDVYVPWFHASQRYFTRVNVTNIRNVYVNRTVINNYYVDYRGGHAPRYTGHDYAYRAMPGAVTAVPRNVFADARPVHPAVLKLDRSQLARTQVAVRPDVIPAKASLGLRRPTARPAVLKGREPFTRPIVARHQPPPRPVEFAAREKIIASQHGQPLTPEQMRNLRDTRPAAAKTPPVKVIPAVAAGAAGAAAFTALRHGTPTRPQEAPARAAGSSFHNTIHPIPARNQPTPPPFKNTIHPIPATPATERRPGELPSARFAHPGQSTSLPRAPEIRPAGEPPRNAVEPNRLPIVRPIERAPSEVDTRANQQRQATAQAQQRMQQMRQQQAQQQQERTREQQAQQREQQATQQRQAQLQQQERQREMQQQRQSQLQEQQRMRDQQIQQQRQMQMQQQRQQQMQQRERSIEIQRQQQQQMRERTMQRAPQPRERQAPERREPPASKRPPASSSDRRL